MERDLVAQVPWVRTTKRKWHSFAKLFSLIEHVLFWVVCGMDALGLAS